MLSSLLQEWLDKSHLSILQLTRRLRGGKLPYLIKLPCLLRKSGWKINNVILRFCTFNRLPGDAIEADPNHTVGKTLWTVYWWWWFSHEVVSDSYDLMDCNPPGSSVHGILQARILEWVAISFSRGPSRPRDRTLVSCIAGRFFI